MTRAFIFPGQGSQTVGMGRELADAFAAARQSFEEVDEALKQNLSRLMFEGPEADLTLTENAQPALMSVSLAVLRVIESEGGVELPAAAALVAGHSLGEYSALAATRAITVADCARLLKRRGEAMQRAVPVGEGAMAAILGLDRTRVEALCAEIGQERIVQAANHNGPGQTVIAGHHDAVAQVIEATREAGVRDAERACPGACGCGNGP